MYLLSVCLARGTNTHAAPARRVAENYRHALLMSEFPLADLLTNVLERVLKDRRGGVHSREPT
jgi:hypothetical protein